MSTEQHGRRLRSSAGALAVLLTLAGALVLAIGIRGQQHAPQPPASAAVPHPGGSGQSRTPTSASTLGTGPAAAVTGPILPASVPTRLDIPAIGVTSPLVQLGLNPDGTVQVPPLDRNSPAGWYRNSPTPGQLGPAILLGHVDSSQYGPAVFFKLGALRPGDTVAVTRADHTAAVFRVDKVESYPKDHFPTLEVYGNTDHATLRLITCGGRFNTSSHSYENNIVAYASLVSSHPA